MREVIPLLWVGAMALGNQLVKSHWKLVATKGNPILGINRQDSWHQVSRHWLCSKLSGCQFHGSGGSTSAGGAAQPADM